jgi:hypothetical protein
MVKKLLALIIFLALAQPTWAATQGIKISPVSFDLTGLPGQKIENVVKVSNPSDREIGVTSAISDFQPQGENGGVEIASNYKYGLSSYLSVFPKSFSLGPGELQYVTVTIDLPKDLPAGARSGVVTFGNSSLAISGSGSVISGQVGVLITLNVLGNLKDQAKLESFDLPKVTVAGPVSLVVRVKNTGQTLAKFSGTVTIYNLLGSKVAEASLGPNNILPLAIRKFSGDWGEKNPFGLYRAELSGSFGQESLAATSYFVGFAPQWSLPTLTIIFVIVLWILHKRKILR